MAVVNSTIGKGSKNRLTTTEALDNTTTPAATPWVHSSGGTVTANNTTAPDGTTTAELLNDTSGSVTFQVHKDTLSTDFSLAANKFCTFSIHLKFSSVTTDSRIRLEHVTGGQYVEASVNWTTLAVTKFTNGSPPFSSVDIRNVTGGGGGWVRLSCTLRYNGTGNLRCAIRPGDNGGVGGQGSIWAWGAQLEVDSVATSYLPITGTTDPLATTYGTIEAWIAATNTLTADQHNGQLRDETFLVNSNSIIFNGTARNSTNYRRLTFATQRYDPVQNIGPKVVVGFASGSTTAGIQCLEGFVTIDGIGIFIDQQPRPTAGTNYLIQIGGAAGCNDCRVFNCFLNMERGGEFLAAGQDLFTEAIHVDGLNAGSKSLRNTFFNVIVKGGSPNQSGHGAGIGIFFGPFAELGGCYNCIVYGCRAAPATAFGFFSSDNDYGTAPELVNCISVGNKAALAGSGLDFGGKWYRADNNISSDTTSRGINLEGSDPIGNPSQPSGIADPGSISGVNAESLWFAADQNDFRVRPGSPAVDRGKDETTAFTRGIGVSPGGGPGTNNDFTGLTRTNKTWDIGPYEGVAAPISTAFSQVTKTVGNDKSRDYPNVIAFIRAIPKSLYYANQKWIADCYPDTQQDNGETADLEFFNCVTGEGNYVEMRGTVNVNPRTMYGHIIRCAQNTDTFTASRHRAVLWVSCSFTRLSNLIIDQTATSASAKNVRTLEIFADDCKIDSVFGQLAGTVANQICIVFDVDGDRNLFTNCLARGNNTTGLGATNGFFGNPSCKQVQFIHCVAYRIKGGPSGSTQPSHAFTFRVDWNACRMTGCIGMETATAGTGGATDFSVTAGIGVTDANGEIVAIDNSISGDTTLQNSPGCLFSKIATDVFNSTAIGDFRLKAGSPALNLGENSSHIFSNDMAGKTRTGSFDAGVFEGIAFPPLLPTPRSRDHHKYASLWHIIRSDGVEHFYCSTNEPISHAGITYEPSGQVVVSARRAEAGLKEQNVEVLGAITSADISAEDLAAGVFTGAIITERIVDWKYPWTTPYRHRVYRIANVQYDKYAWRAELVGLTIVLEQRVGELVGVDCPYELGDEDCQFNLLSVTEVNRLVSSVSSSEPTREFSSTGGSGIANSTNDYFGMGIVIWLTGNNAGLSSQVKSYTGSTRTVRLMFKLPFAIQTSDKFTIKPGCRKRFVADCSTKFSNGINFGGRPFIPGTDRAFETPIR